MKPLWKIIVAVVLGLLVIALAAGAYLLFPPLTLKEATEITSIEVPTFTEIPVDFTHKFDKQTHPFLGAAVIDVNGDGKQELFVGGGKNQDDALFSYQNGALVNVIAQTGLEAIDLTNKQATYGVISLDVDNDSQVDLIIARDDGVYLYLNNKGVFTKEKIPINFEPNSVPFSVAPGDINNDGHVDLYVSTFVDAPNFKSAKFNDPVHGKENILLVNDGDNTFTDKTIDLGVRVDQNTFLSLFVDLNEENMVSVSDRCV